MNLLSKHRILQTGDEWKTDSGEWRAIPSSEFGLQIMFSKYNTKEIRRPSEPESGNVTLSPPTLPVDAPCSVPDCKLEHPKPAPRPLSETYNEAKPKKAKTLPTVVSKRAHNRIVQALPTADEIGRATEERKVMIRKADTAGIIDPHAYSNSQLEQMIADILAKKVAELSPAPVPVTPTVTKPHPKVHCYDIPYTDLSSLPIWIGRNGTFKATGMTVTATANDLIQIRPKGVRGLAKNALIEFPVTEIEKVVDALLRHQKTKHVPETPAYA